MGLPTTSSDIILSDVPNQPLGLIEVRTSLAVLPMLFAIRRTIARSVSSPWWALAAMGLIVAAFTLTHTSLWNPNVTSRLATAQSLVERGTLCIDGSDLETIDKVKIGGHFYSDKPPLMSLLLAAEYLPLWAAGLRLGNQMNLAYFLLTFITMGTSYLLCVACFCDSLRLTGTERQHRAIATGGLALGTIYLAWSTTLSNNGLSASWLFIGFYLLLRSWTSGQQKLLLFLSGLCVSFAAMVDYPVALFFVAFAVYAVVHRALRKNSVYFLLPLLLTLLPTLIINYHVSGSLRPLEITPELYRYPGSYWLSSQEKLSGIRRNSMAFALRYGASCLLGPQGFLLYNPLVLVAIGAIVHRIRHRGPFWVEAAMVGGVSALLVSYYTFSTSNYGGMNYSIRWFVPTIPVLCFFAYADFDDLSGKKRALYKGLLVAGVVIAFVGALNPWSDISTGKPAFLANLAGAMARLLGALGRS